MSATAKQLARWIARKIDRAGMDTKGFWLYTKDATDTIRDALETLGRPAKAGDMIGPLVNIEPLATDYYRHWFETYGWADWEQAVERVATGIRAGGIPPELKGYAANLIALFQYADESGAGDRVTRGLRTLAQSDPRCRQQAVGSVRAFLRRRSPRKATGHAKELIHE